MDNGNCFIMEQTKILDAMKLLDEVSIKVLFVVDNQKLLATVTDGDIRRSILSGVELSASVKKCANYNPITVTKLEKNKCMHIMKENKITAIPIVNSANEIIDIIYADNDAKNNENGEVNLPVVMMAGGKGTRLYPYTKILPKPLIPVEDTPISERIIHSFQQRGCREYYMVVNHKKNMIKAYFNDLEKTYSLEFVDEDKPLGTGGGLQLLKQKINSTFIMTNCDILIMDDISKIIKHHKKSKNFVTMVCSLKNYQIPYGVVNFSEGGNIDSFEEKPKMSFFTNTGYYVLEPEIFNYINQDEKIDMPDIIMRMKEDHLQVGIYPIGENAWLDMGQMDTMEQMEQRLREMKENGLL